MSIASMLADEDGLELRLVVSWKVQLLLAHKRTSPGTGLVLVNLPALPLKDT